MSGEFEDVRQGGPVTYLYMRIPLRDWFAGMAMQRLIEGHAPADTAELAYEQADAMIEAGKETK